MCILAGTAEKLAVDFNLDDCIATVCVSNGKLCVPDIEMQDNYGTFCNVSYDNAVSIRSLLVDDKEYVYGYSNEMLENDIEKDIIDIE